MRTNGTGNARPATSNAGGGLDFWSCRYGVGHWYRTRSARQRRNLTLLVISSPLLLLLVIFFVSYRSHHQGGSFSTVELEEELIRDFEMISKKLKIPKLPNVHLPHFVTHLDHAGDHGGRVTNNDEVKTDADHGQHEQRKKRHERHWHLNPFAATNDNDDSSEDSTYDPHTELSPSEWAHLHSLIPQNSKKQTTVLLAWPTIPVSFKGSDSRAIDAVRFLHSAGLTVDLIYWRDFAAEIHSDEHDDTPERTRLTEAGVRRILGPYDNTPLSKSHTFVAGYDIMVYWLWPHVEFLESLIDSVTTVASANGSTRMIAAVDDVGVALRLLQGALKDSKGRKMEDVEDWLLSKRPVELLGQEDEKEKVGGQADAGAEKTGNGSGKKENDSSSSFLDERRDFDPDKAGYANVLLHQEMLLYTMSDAILGINDATTKFLKKMVPGVPVFQLSYVSPVQPPKHESPKPASSWGVIGGGRRSAYAEPKDGAGGPNTAYVASPSPPFEDRSGYIFFGYNNFANNDGLAWFAREVLPHVNKDHKLHVAGTVFVPTICSCDADDADSNGDSGGVVGGSDATSGCMSKHPNVVCHGALSDEGLNDLVRSSKVSINPVLEPSGVATKTCRSMALGTPVVVSDRDGTFDDSTRRATAGTGARRCTIGPTDVLCFADAINGLLTSAEEWRHASEAAPTFVSEHFGAGQYMRDWASVLEFLLAERRVEIVVQGDALRDGESMPSQNWHIANMLSDDPDFRVSVMGLKMEPPINGVAHLKPLSPLSEAAVFSFQYRFLPVEERTSPFQTGFQADVVVRQGWPPVFDALPISYCGAGCRVVQILPWEFGSLPASWIDTIKANVDLLWAPSEYNRLIYDKSGFKPDRSAVAPAGIDCDGLLASPAARQRTMNDPVVFVFTGGFLPRKGVDILLQEWATAFCGENVDEFKRATLVMHTSYELGYSTAEISEMENTIRLCGNVDWRRRVWMKRDEHTAMLRKADVYVAPFRSEGFGLPIVEALALGLSIIAPVGGTAADDYMTVIEEPLPLRSPEVEPDGFQKLYPVEATEAACTHYPCRGSKLCVFDCADEICDCELLAEGPTWFETNRDDLKRQMHQAYKDVVARRKLTEHQVSTVVNPESFDESSVPGATSFCWSNLKGTYHERVVAATKSSVRRKVPSFTIPDLTAWSFVLERSIIEIPYNTFPFIPSARILPLLFMIVLVFSLRKSVINGALKSAVFRIGSARSVVKHRIKQNKDK